MKIAIIGNPMAGGGNGRKKAYKSFLEAANHTVDEYSFDESFSSRFWYLYQRANAHFLHGTYSRPYLTEKIANKLADKIKRKKYDVIIGIDTDLSYVLTKDLNCLKIFSWECMQADEIYFEFKKENTCDLQAVRKLRELELEICAKSDYVILPCKTSEDYVKKYIWNGSNFVTIDYGCYPQSKVAAYFFPVSIVHLGNLKHHWSNKELLAHLTAISPYFIDVYGLHKPQRRYHLNYKGYLPSLDLLKNYQFGLHAFATDRFSQNRHSSRILTYLAYGLPVLSPDWVKFSNGLKGCIPYNENNFVEVLNEYSERDLWEKASAEAIRQAKELDWNIVLKPLLKLIEK